MSPVEGSVVTVAFAVKSIVLVDTAKCPFTSEQFPPTFHVLFEPVTVTLEFVIVTAPDVKVALSCVAVPAPLLASNTIASVAPGVHVHDAPPDVVDQCAVLEKFPAPPI